VCSSDLNLDGFRFGERVGNIAGSVAGGEQRRRHCLLVDMRGRRFEIKPGGPEHRGAAAALRGEDERAHPAVRSSTSLMTAAAVSSIDRRVTSITGQPLSANIRRAYASSALTRSSST